MANHGVVTYGPDLLTAFLRMETTEHFAQVSLVTELLGKKFSFPDRTWRNSLPRALATAPARTGPSGSAGSRCDCGYDRDSECYANAGANSKA